jgi:hypothetical protein
MLEYSNLHQMPFTADAIERSEIAFGTGKVILTVPADFRIAARGLDVSKVISSLANGPMVLVIHYLAKSESTPASTSRT